jgi:general secretion pathway protein D
MATSLIQRLNTARPRQIAGLALAACASLLADAALLAQQRQPLPARPSGPQFRFQEQVEVAQAQAQAQPEAAPAPRAEPTEIQTFPVAPDRLEQVAADLQKKFKNRQEVRITPNKRISQIIVTAPIRALDEISALLAPEDPDSKPLPPPKPVQQRALRPAAERVRGSHPLKNISASDFELALVRIWNQRATFTTSHDRRTTQVKVPFGQEGLVAITIDHERDLVNIDMPKSAQDSWRRVLRAIDSPRNAGGIQSELVALNRAEPDKVQKALELIRAATPLATGEGPKRHIGQFVSMIFQQEQPAGAQPAAGGQPAEGQPPPAGGEARPGGPVPPGLERAAEAGELMDEEGKIGPVDIQYIEGLDILIIRGRKRDVERVQRIIAQIEAESEKTKPEVEIYMMEHVEDQAMANMINQVYNPALGARQGTVTVVPLVKPNALVLIGRRQALDALIDLIKKIDQPVAPSRQLRIFKLKYLSAIDAETKLRMWSTALPGGPSTQRPGLGTRALIIADYRSNSLIVQASPRDMEEAAHILDTLDINKPGEEGVQNEVRVFRLRNSLADELIQVIQEAIYASQLQQTISQGQGQGQGQNILQQGGGAAGGQAGGGGGAGTPTRPSSSPKPTQLIFRHTAKNGVEELLESGILSDMRLSADPRANALVVTGPSSSMPLIGALIEQLDGLPVISAQVKVFRLENSDATQMATMLQTLFGQQANQQQQGVQGFQSATGGGETTLVPLKFSVDTRTNSIIASGNAGDLAVVYRILIGLDEKELRNRMTQVYRLKNTSAAAVATAINQYLTNRQTLNQNAPNLVSPVNLWEQAIIVVPEPVSQSVIVNASPRYLEDIRLIIQQLDRRLNMVAVQVLIAEVKLSDFEQFGVELGLQDSLLFDRGLGTIGFPFNQANLGNNTTPAALQGRNAAASQGLTNFSLGRTDGTLGFGGLVLSASSDSVNVLVRALQSSQRLQILSRPQVQTVENQTASIQVGATVRFVGGTTLSGATATNSIVTQDIGIILQLTPRTNADGNIIMLVDAQKSELGPEAEGTVVQGATTSAAGVTTAPVRVPQVKITRASTTTNTRSGQTVILGGLITRNQTEITRRVPYLGDIPVLGRLFRTDSLEVERTELLIIMTPYIIQTDEQHNWLNQRESERMSWCLADVANIHGPVPYLTEGGINRPTSPLIFPDETPTGPEEIPPPPAPGIAPPPMGPLPPIILSTTRRNGPQLEPIGIAPPSASPARPQGSSPPQGARNIGTAAPPAVHQDEPTPAAPESTDSGSKTRTIPKSKGGGWPWQSQLGQTPPPPKLYVPPAVEVEPAGYSGAEQPMAQPAEQAIYR